MLFCKNGLIFVALSCEILVLDVFEIILCEFLEVIKGLFADENQIHSVARIVVLVVGFELVVDSVDFEGLQVTDQESIDDGSGGGNVRFLKLVCGDWLIGDMHLILAIYSLHLTVHGLRIEKRLLEEL